MVISRTVFLRVRNVSNKHCTEIQNTLFMLNLFFFENRAVNEIMWKSMVKPDRPRMTIRRMRFVWWITMLPTHSEYVILIAFALQQRLHERSSLLLLKYICLYCCVLRSLTGTLMCY